MDRYFITEHLKQRLEVLDYVYAFWYEGADANDSVDEYSDIDYYIDFEDAYEEEAIGAVESALAELGTIDYRHVMSHGHPKLRQRIYHIEGTSEYLMIDFCFQCHSRDKDEYILIRGDKIEAAKVIFDKAEIIRYKELDLFKYSEINDERLSDSIYRFSQHSRVLKYVRRNQYPEAYAYYNRYVVEPLVHLIRLIHTPSHADFYLIHISSHVPSDSIEKLESLLKVAGLRDIEENLVSARAWFDELLVELKAIRSSHLE